ncbi:O-antigen polymerase [Cupriavidus pinatubonensis]|uniref:O-antigen polymerase n=1 Tax=Cupriavidus pinatubonensis TaxID=248026 RepID=UPI003614DFAB
MFELLLLVTFAGLLTASRRPLGFGNPFQIYFFVWFSLLLGYYLSRDSFIPVSVEFVLLILTAKLLALLIMILCCRGLQGRGPEIWRHGVIARKTRCIDLAQLVAIIALPLVYARATEIAGGESVFTVLGYIQLRAAMTEDGEGYGILAYLWVLSFVTTSVSIFLYRQSNLGFGRLWLSVAVSLCYCYLSTGRTYILFFLCLALVPLMNVGAIRMRGLLITLIVFIALSVFVAGMTAKGISSDDGIVENIESFLESMKGYTIAPLLAFSRLVEWSPDLSWGENTFRLLISIQYALGISTLAPVALMKGYAFVPDPTNVYTVYEVYFRDFSYFGVLIPPVFLIMHYWLYRRARARGGVWIFYYSASVYPLVMQFFQDQYFSLLSTWIQVWFWYWLLTTPHRFSWKKGGLGYA